MPLIKREIYLKRLESNIGRPFIKVLTGLRRVGKSSLLKLLIMQLQRNGLPKKNIIYINMESLEFDHLRTYLDLAKYIENLTKTTPGKKFIFIDEVQRVENWEKALISLLNPEEFEIFVTGSDSKILSSDIATFLRGRYTEIRVYPLTFAEFLTFRHGGDQEKELKNFIKFGGMPGIHIYNLTEEEEDIYKYLEDILNTIYFKDIVERFEIREPHLLQALLKFTFDNLGNITSARSISEFLKKEGRKSSVDTILNYLYFMESSFLINRIKRFDIKGLRLLELNEKIYPADWGLRHALFGYRERDISGILENMVINELLVRGYRVYQGTLDNRKIDFVAEKGNRIIYIQVCTTLATEQVKEREFRNLLEIGDNYPKIVISLDRFQPEEYLGIRHFYLPDFLLSEEF